MALRLYHDEAALQEITAENKDTVQGAVVSGQTLTDEVILWLKSDDSNLTYENIAIASTNTPGDPPVTVEYALDDGAGNPVSYADPLTVPDGAYITAVKIHRKAVSENITGAFVRTNIEHEVKADEFVA